MADAGPGDARLAYHPVVREVAMALRRRCGWRKGERRGVLIAVSGGADSVGLLRLMRLLSGRRGWPIELAVGHVQHHLRGEAAEADARWVDALCGELGVRFERADVGVAPGNVEAEARRARYAALRAMAGRVGAGEVVTAHTATDQWETLLMRMSRGTGLAGLAGIAATAPMPFERAERTSANPVTLTRPMLTVGREAVREMLRAIEQGWREDATNEDAEHRARARLRRDVLPVLKALYPAAERAAGRLAEAVQSRAQDEAAGGFFEPESGGPAASWSASRAVLSVLSPATLGAAVRVSLESLGAPMGGVNAATTEAIARAVRDGRGGRRVFQLAEGWRVEVTREAVVITRPAG
ncbi:MAG: tRNA lysidine(34) synthetase TilS [Planctomycetota bacterium]